MAILLKREF